jgi:hypothetical protein
VDAFLCNANSIKNLSSFEEAKLFFRKSPREIRPKSSGNDFRDNFVTKVAERYRRKVLVIEYLINREDFSSPSQILKSG